LRSVLDACRVGEGFVDPGHAVNNPGFDASASTERREERESHALEEDGFGSGQGALEQAVLLKQPAAAEEAASGAEGGVLSSWSRTRDPDQPWRPWLWVVPEAFREFAT
jgi:hypothetical protein